MPTKYIKECPNCSSKDVVPIVYGLPGQDLIQDEIFGKIKLGGCAIKVDATDRHCNDCEHQFRQADN